MKKEWSTTKHGFLLIEILLASSVFILFMTAFSGAFYYGLQSSTFAGDRARAIMYAEEGQEAVRSIKNVNFSNLVDGTHGLSYSSSTWILSGESDSSDIFTRQVMISTIDDNRKTIDVTVTWQQTPSRTGSVTTTSRLTDWKTAINLGAGITVNKVIINHGLALTASHFEPYSVGATVVSLGSSTIFDAGTYTISENNDSRYNQTFTGDCDSGGQISVATGSSVYCTITNEEKLTYITVNSTVINHGGNFTTANFAPYTVGSTSVTLGAQTLVDSGSYTINESTSTNYTLTYSGDCQADGTIVLNSGDSKVCLLTNEEIIVGEESQSLPGLVIYGDGTSVPKYRTYNQTNNTFGVETASISTLTGKTWVIKTSPTQHLALAGGYDSTGAFVLMCFDGTTWTEEFQVVGEGIDNRHRFDIAFEKTSGNAMVMYSKLQGGHGQLGWKTKTGGTVCGQGWSSTNNLAPLRTAEDVMYVKLTQDRRIGSNLLAVAWVDLSNSISAKIWKGNSWINEPNSVTDNNLEMVLTPHDIENMDIEYESLSGDLMLVWSNANGSNGVNGVRYRTCTGGIANCTWGPVSTPPTFTDDATSLDIAANQETDEIVFASIGKSGGDLQLGYWNGNAWTNTSNVDTSCTLPFATSKLVSVGWLTRSGVSRSVVVYSDLNSNAINWYLGNGGVFSRQPDFTPTPLMANSRGYMDIQLNPRDHAQLMYLTSDSNNNLFAKRLILNGTSTFTWSNPDGGTLEASLPQITSSPFSFSFWEQ